MHTHAHAHTPAHMHTHVNTHIFKIFCTKNYSMCLARLTDRCADGQLDGHSVAVSQRDRQTDGQMGDQQTGTHMDWCMDQWTDAQMGDVISHADRSPRNEQPAIKSPFLKRSPGNEEPVIYGSHPSPAHSTPERPSLRDC